MSAASLVASDTFAAGIAEALENDDYQRLSADERSYAVLACEALLSGSVKTAREWARRQKAAAAAIEELFARRAAKKAVAS